jgi:hypothetical protein
MRIPAKCPASEVAPAFAPADLGRVVTRYDLQPPDNAVLTVVFRPAVALSANGNTIACPATAEGVNRIYVRSRWDVDAHVIPGSDGGTNPALSPDGRSVVFFCGPHRSEGVSRRSGHDRRTGPPGKSPQSQWRSDRRAATTRARSVLDHGTGSNGATRLRSSRGCGCAGSSPSRHSTTSRSPPGEQDGNHVN